MSASHGGPNDMRVEAIREAVQRQLVGRAARVTRLIDLINRTARRAARLVSIVSIPFGKLQIPHFLRPPLEESHSELIPSSELKSSELKAETPSLHLLWDHSNRVGQNLHLPFSTAVESMFIFCVPSTPPTPHYSHPSFTVRTVKGVSMRSCLQDKSAVAKKAHT